MSRCATSSRGIARCYRHSEEPGRARTTAAPAPQMGRDVTNIEDIAGRGLTMLALTGTSVAVGRWPARACGVGDEAVLGPGGGGTPAGVPLGPWLLGLLGMGPLVSAAGDQVAGLGLVLSAAGKHSTLLVTVLFVLGHRTSHPHR